MGLDRGTKLGPYEILDPLGAGGMGEVYRARDLRLDRTVAIKVLPAHLAADEDLRKRMEREARAVSSLSHPHICTLHDIGRENGLDFLVMEYLDGETLAARLAIAKVPFGPREVLQYAVQIADALDHAHRKGVLHRDLKPANIMMTKAGAKLLDFGLAKLEERPVFGDETVALTAALTEKGTILGTFQYMSPEQLEGKESDARSDIFAFGAVVYEMITGKRAFEGKTRVSVISAVMGRDPPPVSSVQPMVPPALDRVVQRCLAKDPEQRWQTARDLTLELQWIADAGSQVGVPAPVAARRKSRELRWKAAVAILALVSLAALGLLAAWDGWFRARSVEPAATRFALALPPNVSLAPGPYAPQIALSPDGRNLAVAAQEPGKPRLLWVRPLGSFSMQRLVKTEGASLPFWSPDGQFIGFFTENKLKKIALSGGSPQTICDAGRGDGAAWNRDGVIVFAPEQGNALLRVPAAGGPVTAATALDKSRGEVQHSWPQFLPDGKHFLYFAMSLDRDKSGIYVQELGSSKRTLVLANPSRGAYAADYLLFSREGVLLAQRLDLKRLTLQGEPLSLAEDVNTNEVNGRAVFTVSENGILAYRGGIFSAIRQLAWYDRQGHRLETVGEPARYRALALSPDEKQVAFARSEKSGSNIWVMELASGILKRLTLDSQAMDTSPVWSPDSQRIIFGRRGGLSEVAVSSGATTVVHDGETAPAPDTWSPDGAFLVYRDPNSRFVSLLPLLGERRPQHVLDTPFPKSHFCFSPDSRWIAYTSAESGRGEVQVASFPSFTDKRTVSQNGGTAPKWRKDGKELFFISSDGRLMMAAEVRVGSKIETGIPRPLFSIVASAFLPSTVGTMLYDITGDGRKFLLNEMLSESAEQISVVLNWPADLRH